MQHRKFFAFLLVALLLLAFAAAPALAAATPPAIEDTYTIDGVTYYNVNSKNFDSDKKFYEDVFKTRHSSLGGLSLGDLWILTAAGLEKDVFDASVPDYVKEIIRKGQYGSGSVSQGTYEYKAPQWNNDGSSGYVETRMVYRPSSRSSTDYLIIRFKDFGVGVILPGKSSHYVSTVIDNDTSKGEEPASSAKNDSGTAAAITQSISKHISATMSSTIDHSFSYGFKEGIKVGAGFNAGIFSIAGEISFEANQTITDGWSKTDTKSDGKDINNSVSVTLPPYTTAMIKQGETNATMTTNYNCPVMLSYKVEIYLVRGFTTRTYTFSPKAREDLQKRALFDVDYDPQKIKWRTVFEDSDAKDAVEKIATYVPMSPTGAKMVYTSRSVYNEVTGIAALYPLSYVSLGWPNLSFISGNKDRAVANMTIGEYSYTNYLPLEGYNDRGAAYYGFNSGYGSWRVVDEAGKVLPEVLHRRKRLSLRPRLEVLHQEQRPHKNRPA
ncbi:MAG: aerolysin family beta-barrel pore-forming toxin [Synergistaceae bacterium]|nr:aerolysin family beta-barrel pore-forming toxin [Synergistaceae bacterium]